ncbi:MAG: type II toxin-antitoxin system VapC family toxin [Nitrospinae bacterium]|nr:type II toxin-antitoxin system VapC family toxin [Nitrospinota bacterium]
MNVVDTSGWLEYFCDGANAEKFVEPLEDTNNLIVPTITIFEVYKVVYRERGESAALETISMMRQGIVIDLDQELALLSAKTSIDYRIPMADSIVLTTAQMHEAILWTQDSDFKDIQGVRFFPKQ